MNTKLKSIFKTITLSLGALLLVTTATYALGTLTPQGTAGDDTHYTLNDIYEKISDYTYDADEPSGTISTPEGEPAPSFYSLTEIYNLLANQPDLTPENIAQGKTILGVAGTLSTEPADLEWSSEQGSMNWDTAVSTCAALTEGGATAGDWRLPTISELLAGISDDWIIDGSGSRFAYLASYWSAAEYDGSSAWHASWSDYVFNYLDDKTYEYSVRCVR